MIKKKVLFVARTEQQNTAEIKSELFDPYFVVLQRREKKVFERKNIHVDCFEEEYAKLKTVKIEGNYLKTSLSTDRFLYRFPFEKRIEILGKEIQFWRNIIDYIKPNFIVNETVAIELNEVLCIEARTKNIPVYTYLSGFYPNTFYWKPDPFSARMEDLSTFNPTQEQLEYAKNYIKRVVEKHERPYYVQKAIKHKYFSFSHLVSELIRSTPRYIRERIKESKKPFYYEYNSATSYNFLKAYFRNLLHSNIYDDLSDLDGKNIVFYPMHMEPEATLSYFVDSSPSQESIIRGILNSMCTNQCLVVKEHPQHVGLLTNKNYRDLKEHNKNIIFLRASVSSFDVLNYTSVIVTLTSTAAWEGLLLGKPVIVLGKIFFDQCTGATRCEDFKQLSYLLRHKKYVFPQFNLTLKFVTAMANNFHEGCPTATANESSFEQYIKAIESICLYE